MELSQRWPGDPYHYFAPSEDNDRFCAVCGKYLTDEMHFRYTDGELAVINN